MRPQPVFILLDDSAAAAEEGAVALRQAAGALRSALLAHPILAEAALVQTITVGHAPELLGPPVAAKAWVPPPLVPRGLLLLGPALELLGHLLDRKNDGQAHQPVVVALLGGAEPVDDWQHPAAELHAAHAPAVAVMTHRPLAPESPLARWPQVAGPLQQVGELPAESHLFLEPPGTFRPFRLLPPAELPAAASFPPAKGACLLP